MITQIVPLSVGNAFRLFLKPPASAAKWRVLRKGADTFAGHDDAGAFVVHDGTDKSFVDFEFLQNGQTYFYRPYYLISGAWTAGDTVSASPVATYEDASTDALSVVRDRIDYGLAVEVARGVLIPKSGGISVLTAPPVFEQTRWPMVSVHLLSEGPQQRGVGEIVETDFYDGDDWTESEGWLARAQIAVIGWSLNPDERIALRQALRRVVIANLPVFDACGMLQIEFMQQDIDAVSGEYPAPVYQAAGTLTCLAPIVVRGRADPITDVQLTVSVS